MNTTAEGPELRAAKGLLDLATNHGFAFQRVAPGPDGPLFARRDTIEHCDEIYLGGFSDSCHATRARKSSLIVPGGLPITARVTGDALTVLHTVISDWDVCQPPGHELNLPDSLPDIDPAPQRPPIQERRVTV